ncbi:MAG: DUF2214 family protein [Pseudomonadota bacterium]
MSAAIAAYLHFLAIFALFALLTLEHQLLRLPLDLARARSLFRIDIAYGICAALVLASGAARLLWYGKGLDYYLHNSLLQAKFGLFILVGLISALPTFTFLSWRNDLKAGRTPVLGARQAHWVMLVIRLELSLLLIIPLLATLMARGYGVGT